MRNWTLSIYFIDMTHSFLRWRRFTPIIMVSFWMLAFAAVPSLVGEVQVPCRVASIQFFNATGRSDLESLCYGLPDLMAVAFGNTRNVVAIDRSSLDAIIREQGLTFGKAASTEAGLRLGKLANANAILTGSFMGTGTLIRISVQLTDVTSAAVLKSITQEGPLTNLLALCEQIAQNVTVGNDGHFPFSNEAAIDSSPIANLQVIRGLQYYWRKDYDLAIVTFLRAYRIEPTNADATYWIGKAYEGVGDWAHAWLALDSFARSHPKDGRNTEVRELMVKCLAKSSEREKHTLAELVIFNDATRAK